MEINVKFLTQFSENKYVKFPIQAQELLESYTSPLGMYKYQKRSPSSRPREGHFELSTPFGNVLRHFWLLFQGWYTTGFQQIEAKDAVKYLRCAG